MFDWLSTDFFMPHGHCYLWDPRILWLQVLTNLSIALAYFAISATLGVLVWRAKDIPFKWMYAAFGVFIVTCGFTHLMDVVVIWKPQYWLDSMIRLVTAIASVMTAVLLPPLVPQALAIARGAKAAHDRGIALETAVKELELMYARARELDDQKTRFFANVSHELRTPLTLILGPLGKLRDADLPEEDRRHVEVIDRNARALLKHVNELLDVARVDAGGLAPSYADVDVAHLVRSSAAAFESAAAERRITLTVRTPDEQRAAVDPDQLQRVLVNLLGNAFKFTPDGGAVRCELRGGAGDVRVVVADSGPGIPPDERELVFERFRQSPSTSPRHQASSGLGLAIVRELVRLHEGRVEVGDAAEGGAEFRITLPVEAPPDAVVRRGVAVAPPEAPVLERPEVPRAAAVAPSPGAQVVVVEDNPDLRQYIAETLEEHATVVTAADGHAGLEAVTRTRPDLVVTDVMMPGMSGDRLLDALRAAPETRDTPVLVLTAKADDQLRVELLRRGAQDFLAKPFAADELRARCEPDRDRPDAAPAPGAARLPRGRRRRARPRPRGAQPRPRPQRRRDADRARPGGARQPGPRRAPARGLPRAAHAADVDRDAGARAAAGSGGRRGARARAGAARRRADAARRAGRPPARARPRRGRPADGQPRAGRARAAGPRRRRRARAARGGQGPRAAGRRARGAGRDLDRSGAGPDRRAQPRRERDQVHRRRIGDDHARARRRRRDDRGPDTGRGIAAADQARIFEPFERLEPVRQKHTAGLGLGLSLVRDVLDALGGSIAVDSELGRGSTFTIRLPG